MSDLVDKALVSSVFEEEKQAAALDLFKDMGDRVAGMAEEAVKSALGNMGLRPRRKISKLEQKYRYLKDVFDNGGVDRATGEKWTISDYQGIDAELCAMARKDEKLSKDLQDMHFSGEQPLLFRRVVEETVKEAIEPNLLLTPLLQRMSRPGTAVVQFPAMSGYTAQNLDVVEHGEYTTGDFQFAGRVTCTIGKAGIMVSMTDEAKRYSMLDLWGMHLRHAARALARHKEQKVVDHVLALGSLYFDNSTISGRKTTGRDVTGAFNGTFTQDDLFDMWADLMQDGYVPDTLIMHPFAWTIFARDPILRNLGYLNGTGSNVISAGYQGQPANAGAFNFSGLAQERLLTEPANTATTYANVPRTWPFGQMRIIVTPFVPFDFTNNVTDIYLCDSRDFGILVVDEEIVTEEWRDAQHDVSNLKLRERYGVASANQGRGIRRAKNVVVAKAYDFSQTSIVSDIGALPTSEIVI